jgi:hypothetical protein
MRRVPAVAYFYHGKRQKRYRWIMLSLLYSYLVENCSGLYCFLSIVYCSGPYTLYIIHMFHKTYSHYMSRYIYISDKFYRTKEVLF